MHIGLLVSLFLHTGVLAWAFISLETQPNIKTPNIPSIEATLISPAQLTKLQQGSPSAKKLQTQPDKKPKKKIEKKPLRKKAQKKDKLRVPTKQTEKKKSIKKTSQVKKEKKPSKNNTVKKKKPLTKKKEVKQKDKPQIKNVKRATDQRKDKKRKKFDINRISALLNKTPEKQRSPQATYKSYSKTKDTGIRKGERTGKDNQITARERDLLTSQLSSQIKGCWRLPGGGGGLDNAVVTLVWSLKPDGSLDGMPIVKNPRNDPVFVVASEAAIRAVVGCAPYLLPQKYYSSWKKIIWSFDPRDML